MADLPMQGRYREKRKSAAKSVMTKVIPFDSIAIDSTGVLYVTITPQGAVSTFNAQPIAH